MQSFVIGRIYCYNNDSGKARSTKLLVWNRIGAVIAYFSFSAKEIDPIARVDESRILFRQFCPLDLSRRQVPRRYDRSFRRP